MLGSDRSAASNNWSDPVQKAYWKKLHETVGITPPKKTPPGPGGNGKVIDVKPVSVEHEPEERFICVQLLSTRRMIVRMFDNQDPRDVLIERGLQGSDFRDATNEEIGRWREGNSG